MLQRVDIVIVGAGAYGTAVLGQLAMNTLPAKLRHIMIIERSKICGPGMPYSEDNTIPDHIVNIAGGCTQITATYIPISEQSDFLQWLRGLSPEERKKLNVESEEASYWLYRPFPRFVVGKYLECRFHQFVATLRSKGFSVNILTETIVGHLEVNDSSGYELHLNNGSRVRTEIVFLATGHFSYKRFGTRGQPGWIDSPYPPTAIQENIPSNEHVGILGSSLSAIDAVLSLASSSGTFHRQKTENYNNNTSETGLWHKGKFYDRDVPEDMKSGKLVFLPRKENSQFKVTMYSRNGMLPQVMGVVVNKILSYTYLTPEFFIPIISKNNGFLPLDEVWSLLKREIVQNAPEATKLAPFDWDKVTLEEAVALFMAYMRRKDTKEILADDIQAAKRSLRGGIPLPLQNIFYQSYSIFDEILGYFSAEDYLRWERILTPLHLLIGPFPVQNAEKLLALMEANILELKAIGEGGNVKRCDGYNGVDIVFGNGKIVHHDYMIDATGQKTGIKQDKSLLTESLLKNELLSRNRYRFVQKPGKEERQDSRYIEIDGISYIEVRCCALDK